MSTQASFYIIYRMLRNVLLLLIAWTIALPACQDDKTSITVMTPMITVTTAVLEDASPTPPEIKSTPTVMPEPATALPTTTPVPTPTPSLTPTQTPIPASAVKSITLEPILEGTFTRPVYLTHAYDQRLFVVEQAGLVRIVKDGQLLDQPFLDLSDRVGSSQLEQGLLSIAFHPNFPEDDRFFVYYTDINGNSNLSSFSVSSENPDLADAASQIVLLTLDQPYPNHNGGQLNFGPDGYLYLGLGDGGNANDPLNSGQDASSLLGTLLRLDVDDSRDIYAAPSSNPFIADDDRRDEIWAWGLRNPWRFSFDRLTGDLFVADVGESLWEEVHFQPGNGSGGENYGWNILEGSHCHLETGCNKSGLELPIFEYDHQGNCSITGGYVYRGKQHLALYGNYFVADYCSGNIWALFPEPDGSWAATNVLDSDHVVSSFGEDVAGELYLLDHNQGSIYHLRP